MNSLCNRAILLEHGRVKLAGSPKEVTEVYFEDMFESLQGKSALPAEEAAAPSARPSLFTASKEADFRDMRQDFLNGTTLRNDIQVFRFDEKGAAFGKGGAVIENAVLADERGAPLSWVVGGELVTLHVLCRAMQDLYSPIVGFHLKDRLGQALTGDSTHLSFMDAPLSVPSGARFSASFSFRMPVLAAGDYSFAIALAEGTQAEHVQHQWRHDAIILSSVSTSVSTGLMGIPMRGMTLGLLDENER